MNIFEALNIISGALDYVYEELGAENFTEISKAEDIIYNYVQEKEGQV